MAAIETATEVFGGQKPVAEMLGISVRALYDKREGNTGISDAEVRTLIRNLTAMAERCQRITANLLADVGGDARRAAPAAAPLNSLTAGASA